MKKETIVVALGGNALIGHKGKKDIKSQLKIIQKAIKNISGLFNKYNIVITNGNAFQVGELLLQNELAKEKVPASPLDILDAETQGEIGYLIEQSIINELQRKKIKKPVVNISTQVLVSTKDKAFKDPTKPIGSFYSLKEVGKLIQKGYNVIDDSGRGYRRVVPSPKPIKIIEAETIKKLINDTIVIACGGGGIPVVRKMKKLTGVEAVIDKDRASACLAKEINASELLILTSVDNVYLNFNKKNQKILRNINVKEAEKYLISGQFPKGSMGPKVEAAIDFLKHGGKKVIITSLYKVDKAIKGKAGTLITR